MKLVKGMTNKLCVDFRIFKESTSSAFKGIFYLFFVCSFLLLGIQQSFAEVYRCKNVWTNVKCESGLVNLKAKISKVPARKLTVLKREPATGEAGAKQSLARARLAFPNFNINPIADDCQAGSKGADLRLSVVRGRVFKESGLEKVSIIGRINNISKESSPANVVVVAKTRAGRLLGKTIIGKPIEEGRAKPFNIPITDWRMGKNIQVPIQVALHFNPAAFCDTALVSPSELVVTHLYTPEKNLASLLNPIEKELNEISKAVTTMDREYRKQPGKLVRQPVENLNGLNVFRLQGRLEASCIRLTDIKSSGKNSAGMTTLFRQCRDLRNKMSVIRTRKQIIPIIDPMS